MKLVQVIVDVTAMQTDTPYTYGVPIELQDQIDVGSRLLVPFGKSNRPIQAFVISEAQEAVEQMKDIIAILDNKPTLTPELVQLSKWISEETFAFRISCLNAMLPNALKVTTKRSIKIISDEVTTEQLIEIFGQEQMQDLRPADLSAKQQRQLNDLIANDQVELIYHTNDEARSQKVTKIYPLLTTEKFREISESLAKSKKVQIRLLDLLQNTITEDGIEQVELVNQFNIGRSTINTAVDKGWIEKRSIEKYRDPFSSPVEPDEKFVLNDEQQVAYDDISTSVDQRQSDVFLLEGVTGSGKTEVYLQSIETALQSGRTALMLVPEISLTPLMVNRVRARFGNEVAALHSGLSDGEKFDEWRRIDCGEAKVVVGARSAVFAPLTNIGIIIVDEEHSSTYKQEDNPRYHARDVAIKRAQTFNCPVVLGSATPSLESRARCEKGLIKLLTLTKRSQEQSLPEVKIVDMRNVSARSRSSENFSNQLVEAIQDKLNRKEQVVLLLNRRGFSSFVMCRSCGFVLKCPNCDISLTLHMDSHSMRCHYCGHEEAIPQTCANCGSNKIRFYGVGTEKIEKELNQLFPEAGVIRMDVDTTRRKGAHEKLLARFGNHEGDILLGTQMIAKGLDFPDVTLVGVLNADTALELPDFRASERTFQLLTQVSGRAGRADKTGEVYIQTYNPEHYAIKLAQKQDYEDFYHKEMYLRNLGKYAPFYYSVQITIDHQDEKMAVKKAYEVLNDLQPNLSKNAIVLGPSPKAIARIKQRYFYQIVVKYKRETNLKKVLQNIRSESQDDYRKGYNINIDVEPQNFV
ncbi:primosomal protein N' [Pediococcus argentinicus]|uniref:Replication restart protein PriA n=1 Tax=Pediococcus argentinicus TaxID=480391 RepID=A0A0R2NHB0_9LACO|nr:primosomal protein N' [Pediococcus argentinicus]KRO25174.1 replication restart DNA helicase PriA [Pediococcus argentinicus]NKZ22432.1 primosomal protein N' [Pediococcus argentinicus]GEP19532.1 primosomal protein N' [Pediococcus argentinicus]